MKQPTELWDTFEITPVAKPRQTRRDKWNPSKSVLKYRAFRDECRLKKVMVPEGMAHIMFVIPMPKSWSNVKKERMAGTPHQQKPDVDNLLKGLLDSCYQDDSCVWDVRATKIWGETGKICVKRLPTPG